MHLKPLIISNNPFSIQTNNGKTLESIFSKFNKTYLSQLFFTEYLNPDFNFCDNYFRITDKDVLRNLMFKKYGGEIKNGSNLVYSKGEKFFVKKNKFKILHLLRDFLWSFNSWKSSKLFSWIEKNNPNFIFFVAGGDRFSHNIALFISRKYNIPLITYFTDDYVLYDISSTFFDKYIHNIKIQYFQKLIDNSKLCFVICDYMAVEYEKYFQKKFLTLINTVEINAEYDFTPFNTNEYVISYFGSLHTNRDLMLLKFSQIVKNIESHKIHINVYTNSEPNKDLLDKFKTNSINYKGSLIGEELSKAMKSSNFLLHIESDDKFSISKTRLSVSTKIPEYLSTCKPIISFGPSIVASLKIQIENKIGFVLDSSNSIIENSILLLNLIDSIEQQIEITSNGFNFAKSNFNRHIQSDFFKSKIYKILTN